MKRLLCAAFLCLLTVGCDNAEVKANETNPPEQSVTISRKDYETLKAQAALYSHIGRYQLQVDGVTTWRLDTSTGESCLLLASKSYWANEGNTQRRCTPENDPLGIR